MFGLWTFVHDFGASARAIDERVSLRLGLNVGQRCSAYRVSREFLVFSEPRVSLVFRVCTERCRGQRVRAHLGGGRARE